MPETQGSGLGIMSKIKNVVGGVVSGRNSKVKEIDSKLAEVEQRNSDLETKMAGGKAMVKSARIEALRKLYDIMQRAGVDPTNLDSIAQFREKLMAEDPDLAELFFRAFDELTQGLEEEGGDMEGGPKTAPPQDLMGQATTNLQQGMMRQ